MAAHEHAGPFAAMSEAIPFLPRKARILTDLHSPVIAATEQCMRLLSAHKQRHLHLLIITPAATPAARIAAVAYPALQTG